MSAPAVGTPGRHRGAYRGRRLLLAFAGAVAVRAGVGPPRVHRPAWRRANYRGEVVSLAGGPALAAAATAAAAAGAPHPAAAGAAMVAGLGAGGVGLYDDLAGLRGGQPVAKGFHGHLGALRAGRVTSGTVKMVGGVGAGVIAAALLDRGTRPGAGSGDSCRRLVAGLLGGGLVAGSANLVNLLDLRPGRALKVGLVTGTALAGGPAGGLAAGPAGACAGLLREDLDERAMLGDSGANALGALLGLALAARTGPRGRAVALAVVAALTAASERISFTRVIARNPVLRRLDDLGRSPDPPGSRHAEV